VEVNAGSAAAAPENKGTYAKDPLATQPPAMWVEDSSRHGWATLLEHEVAATHATHGAASSSSMVTAPPGALPGDMMADRPEPSRSRSVGPSALWQTQLPDFWDSPRSGPKARVPSPADEEDVDMGPSGAVPQPADSASAAAEPPDAAARDRPAHWQRAGRGGRFGSNDERKRFYWEKSVEVRLSNSIRDRVGVLFL